MLLRPAAEFLVGVGVDDVPVVCDGPVLVVLSAPLVLPTKPVNLESEVNEADAEPFLHVLLLIEPVPETNLTVAHWEGQRSQLREHGGLTWYKRPSGALLMMLRTPCLPSQLELAFTLGMHRLPRPDCWKMG